LGGEELAVANRLCFSATADIFQFLKQSGSGNVAYIDIRDSSDATRHNKSNLYARNPNKSQQETKVKEN
jgi:hypothetical protein